jgi:hypothetical protein
MTFRTVLTLTVLALGFSSVPMLRGGVLIDVQFGCTAGAACNGANASSAQQTGAALIGNPGDVWNLVSGNGGLGTTGSNVPLVDSTGVLTSATVSWTSLLDWVVIPGEESGFGSTPDANLMSAYIVSKGYDTITIDGLTPNAHYALYVIMQAGVFSTGRQAAVSVNGGPPVVAAPMDQNASTFISGQNYEAFDTSADGLGKVTILYSSHTGEADINGFQLSQSPEPSGLYLGIAGLAAVITLRRRVRR